MPRNAWLAEIDDEGARIVCGRNVERFPGGIVEGIWNSSFTDGAFDQAKFLFGSGVKVEAGRLRCVGPCHPLEALFAAQRNGRIVASNSLAFALTYLGIELPVAPGYTRRLATSVRGIRDYDDTLWAKGDTVVKRYVGAIVEIDAGGIRHRPRDFDIEQRFESYEDYTRFLVDRLKALFENGADPARRHPLKPIASCSAGFDSTACAALAAEAGCREAVTFTRSRIGELDSGRPVAEALGLEAHEFDQWRYIEEADMPEVEFMATGMGGEDYPFGACEPVLPDTMLVTGFFGDPLWCPEPPANDNLKDTDLSGASLSEFRLRLGFVHVPMIFIGAVKHAEIRRISHTPEVWRYGGGADYNRPIAQRILEERGVPRRLYGQKDRAVSMLVFRRSQGVSQSTRRGFESFLGEHLDARLRVRQAIWRLRDFIYLVYKKLCRIAGIGSSGMVERVIVGEWPVFEHSSPVHGDLMFIWALRQISPRYAPARRRREDEQSGAA